MISTLENGAWLINGVELIEDQASAAEAVAAKSGKAADKVQAKQGTIAYGILKDHNTSDNMDQLKIKFDKLTSHDITYVGIIQSSRSLTFLQTATTHFAQ